MTKLNKIKADHLKATILFIPLIFYLRKTNKNCKGTITAAPFWSGFFFPFPFESNKF